MVVSFEARGERRSPLAPGLGGRGVKPEAEDRGRLGMLLTLYGHN